MLCGVRVCGEAYSDALEQLEAILLKSIFITMHDMDLQIKDIKSVFKNGVSQFPFIIIINNNSFWLMP